MNIFKYEPFYHNVNDKRELYQFKFDNGYGASVFRVAYYYGGDVGLYELAVLKFDGEEGHICYTTPIIDDVVDYLSVKDVNSYLDKIKALL